MLKLARDVAPGSSFIAATAEALPFRERTFDLITAAGSLNYADTARFFTDARRVLDNDGAVVVYDFGPGREFPESTTLNAWFDEFERRYPWPPAEGHALTPSLLASLAEGFAMEYSEEFAFPLAMTPALYADYVMTETNVAYALRTGVPVDEIRGWCAQTVEATFGGRARDVVFRGYIACFRLTTTAVP
jgi:SAM-dependent methyltransferase